MRRTLIRYDEKQTFSVSVQLIQSSQINSVQIQCRHWSIWQTNSKSPVAICKLDRTKLLLADSEGERLMRRLVYAMTTSLDGYIAGPDGGINWSPPDEELFRFHTQRVEETEVQLCGRRLYETMLYWENVDQSSLSADQLKFAKIWNPLPKVVFSTTLESVGSNTRLLRSGLAEEVAILKEQPGKDIAVGGAHLANECMKLNLIDEWRLFVCPVLLGGGTPYFSSHVEMSNLELLETRTFGSRVVYLRYGRTR